MERLAGVTSPLPVRPSKGVHIVVPRDRIDLIVAEVKEGKVNINSGARDPAVLGTVVSRFGAGIENVDGMVRELLERKLQ